jgi:hypothetical protein
MNLYNYFNIGNIRNVCLLACAGLLTAPLAAHAQNPFYFPETGTMSIPSIDMEARMPPGQLSARYGGYHDVLLEFVQGDLWRLKKFTPATEIPGVKKARVVKTDAFPVQVFVEVEGSFGNPCARPQLERRRIGNTFYISIQEERPSPLMACITVEAPFSWIVPLEVYGLPAGDYKYVVNRGLGPILYTDSGSMNTGVGLTGSFALAADNVFPRTAPDYPRFINPETTQVQISPR